MFDEINPPPKKIYVELTTRCNLQCQMCVKYAAGSCIPEGDMPLDVFKKILPSLADVDTLILNGIGESLLHPDLHEIVALARKHMPAGSTIGLQSNGLLLSQENARGLVNAGLTTICLSVDGFTDSSCEKKEQREHSFSAVKRAVENLDQAKNGSVGTFKLGLEIVLTRQSIQDLPVLVRWAADNSIDYILTSHLFLYDEGAEDENLFNPHPEEALELYSRYNEIAISQGFDLQQEVHNYRRHAGTKSSPLFLKLMNSLSEEAKSRDIQLNFEYLYREKLQKSAESKRLLDDVAELARISGLDIFIPPIAATLPRECRFMSERATFIAVNGDVLPCHFLWHTYSCRVLKDEVNVIKRPYGNITGNSLESIWQSKEYSSFREEAEEYQYAPCWTCSQGPCSSLVSDQGGYANDCYGSQVPCGHCLWNLGGIRCL